MRSYCAGLADAATAAVEPPPGVSGARDEVEEVGRRERSDMPGADVAAAEGMVGVPFTAAEALGF